MLTKETRNIGFGLFNVAWWIGGKTIGGTLGVMEKLKIISIEVSDNSDTADVSHIKITRWDKLKYT